MRLLISGGFGLIGSRLLEVWAGKYDVMVLDREDQSDQFKNVSFIQTNITKGEEVEASFKRFKPDVVLHLAAYTNVEKAEEERQPAWDLNVFATRLLAEAAQKAEAHFIYFSTGFVFEGKEESNTEEDNPKPVNYYGLTKMEGERTLQKAATTSTIVRINFPYGGKWVTRGDLIKWMIEKLLRGEEVELVNDQHISPTFIDDLPLALDRVIEKKATGIYHATGGDCLTLLDIGRIIASEFGFEKSLIKETTLDEFLVKSGRRAVQPRWSCLLNSKLETELGIKMTNFPEGIEKVKESYS